MRRWILLAAVIGIVAPASGQPIVRGTVLTPQGTALRGARVTLVALLPVEATNRLIRSGRLAPEPAAATVSDAAGRFRLAPRETAVWRLVVEADGHVPMHYFPLVLTAPTELGPVVLPRDQGADMTLLDPRGMPLADAWIWASGAETGSRGWQTSFRAGRTDTEGRVDLPRAPGELLDVRVVAGGRTVASRAGVESGTVRLEAPAEGLTEAWEVRPAEPVELAGRVIDRERRRPIAGALVWPGTDPGAFSRTDAEGRYRLRAPPAPGLWIQVEAAAYVPRLVALGPEHLAGRRAPTAALVATTALGGVVTDPAGAPVPGVLIEAVGRRRGKPRGFFRPDPADGRALSDGEGRFRIEGLEVGLGHDLRMSRAGFTTSWVREADQQGGPVLKLTLAPARGGFGRVVDEQEQPIDGAEVILTPSGARRPAPSPGPPGEQTRQPFRVWTDAEGRFEVSELPAAEIQLTVYRSGYSPITVRGLEVPNGAPPGPVDLGTVVLVPGLRLTGRVVDRRGEGVAGAAVHVLRNLGDSSRLGELAGQRIAEQTPDAETDSHGDFMTEGFVAGETLHLFVHRGGYAAVWVERLTLPLREALTVVLEPGFRVAGRVVDEAGEGVENAELVLEREAVEGLGDYPSAERDVRSDGEGRFAIEDLRPGTVRLSVFHPAFVEPEPVTLRVTAEEDTGDVTLVLERGAVLSGEVSTEGGEPVAEVHVVAGSAASFTDADGVYRLEGVAPGSVTVVAEHPHYGRREEPLEVDLGLNTLDLIFLDGFEVRGRVVDEEGGAVAGAAVRLMPDDHRALPLYRGNTSADGSFLLRPVADGTYRLAVRREGFAPADPARTVRVSGAAVEDVEVVLSRGATLSGRILGLAFDELARVRVEAEPAVGPSVAGHVDYEGRYRFRDLAPGDWRLEARLDGGRRQVQARLSIAPGTREMTRDLRFEERFTLSGSVLHDGEPVPGTIVSLAGLRSAVQRSVTADFQGSFRIEDLAAGPYRLGLANPRHRLVHNQDVELEGDREIVLDLRPARLSGMVVEASSGHGVGQALVILRRQTEDGQTVGVLSTGTGPAGAFDFPRVPEGRYLMLVRKDGYAADARPIEVSEGLELRGLELTVEATRGVELDVRLASGELPRAVTVVVMDLGGRSLLRETRGVDAQGRAHLPTVPAGSWQLVVSAPGTVPATLTVSVPGETVALTLSPAGTLDVRVPALSASDLVARLRLLGPDRRPHRGIDPAAGVVESWRLIGGRATVEGVPAGVWELYVTTPDGQSWSGAAVSVPGAVVPVRLE